MTVPSCDNPSCCAQPVAARCELGNLVVDFDRIEIRIGGRRVHLSPQQFKLIGFLALHPNKIHGHDEIMPRVFGDGDESLYRTGALRTLVCRVRRVLSRWGTDSSTPDIEARYGNGYGLMLEAA